MWRICLLLLAGALQAAGAPNIVVILADDLGYGDLRCYNKDGGIPTPHLDRMAVEGLRFTDAHSASAVCTPTRYGLLTGRYCWRSRLKKGVLGGWSPHLIEEGRTAVASLLRERGYITACIGKWHLGMDWPATGNFGDAIEPARRWQDIDFTRPAVRGPLDCGFSEYFGISASLDMPPFAFLRGDRTTGPLTATQTYLRTGPATAGFSGDQVVSVLRNEAITFLTARAEDRRPFFLYLALTSPHTPVLPSETWRGRSTVGPYGDFVMETDAAAGAVLDAVKTLGLDKDTLVLFTSDNGATPDNANTLTTRGGGHRSNGDWRGTKADIWEGGHRVPFIARWPGRTPAGGECHDPICLNTLFSTAAELTGEPVTATDSYSIAPWLRGETPNKPTHPFIIHHSIEGMFAIRRGDWKFIAGKGSGGWSEGALVATPGQLYNLARDPGEGENLFEKEPAMVAELSALLAKCQAER
jgi:arylsulfatase A